MPDSCTRMKIDRTTERLLKIAERTEEMFSRIGYRISGIENEVSMEKVITRIADQIL